MDISYFSKDYLVKYLEINDVDSIYELSFNNPLFYQYCPPFVTRESILEDMKALPPNTDIAQKHYIGFFNGEKLIAIMDLIEGYPAKNIAFIGLFMMDKNIQGKGIGSKIIEDSCEYLKELDFEYVQLAYCKGNPQASHFWHKNYFLETGIEKDNGDYLAVVCQRKL